MGKGKRNQETSRHSNNLANTKPKSPFCEVNGVSFEVFLTPAGYPVDPALKMVNHFITLARFGAYRYPACGVGNRGFTGTFAG